MDDSDLVTPKTTRARPKTIITFSSDEGEDEEGEKAVPCTSFYQFGQTLIPVWHLIRCSLALLCVKKMAFGCVYAYFLYAVLIFSQARNTKMQLSIMAHLLWRYVC